MVTGARLCFACDYDTSALLNAAFSKEEMTQFTAYAEKNPSFDAIHILSTALVEGFGRWTDKRALCIEFVEKRPASRHGRHRRHGNDGTDKQLRFGVHRSERAETDDESIQAASCWYDNGARREGGICWVAR
jgi:hypothetical protein